jgi:nitroimidazol reductase NimA-like FMN-containing flavoprotein (pyridoxamine 5'-phosphate oxidase superfamily)
MTQSLVSDSTKVRYEARGHYDRDTVHAILDASYLAHVGLVAADGRPVVIPMLYVRQGETLIVHGSPATRLLRTMRKAADVCVTVTLLDGLVLARSAFHHSVNYRSVVVLGRAEVVEDHDEKVAALELLTDHVAPGRVPFLRAMSAKEAQGTSVLRIPIREASAKIREGGPSDDEEDYALPIWAGVVPTSIAHGTPVPDLRNLPDLAVPDHVTALLT